MDIKGIELQIMKGKKVSGVADLSEAVIAGASPEIHEKNVRQACLFALKAVQRSHQTRLKFYVNDASMKIFSAVAIAKILAQEIYRFAKEERSRLRAVDIILPTQKLFGIFEKTIFGYLKHLLEVLTQGPFMTVDALIEVKGGVVLIRRSNPPFGWAIPGGFVDYNESLEKAVWREANEETGLNVKDLKQMHTYSKPGRDPRFHTITTVFVGQAQGKPCGASDALEAGVFSPAEWRKLPLAFDHRQVLEDYLKWKRKKKV